MNTQRYEPTDRRTRTLTALLGLAVFLGLSLGLTAQAQDKDKKEAAQPVKPALEAGKDAKDARDAKPDGPQYRLRNAVRLGYTPPASPDHPMNNGKALPIPFHAYKG